MLFSVVVCAGEGARADSKRAAGNEHFKTGRYEEALEASVL